MVTIELTKDKFGETITVSDINGNHSFAERNSYERIMFNKYRTYLAKFNTLKLIDEWSDLIEVEND